MSKCECEKCKYAILDYEEYYPCVRHYVVSDCRLENSNENGDCEDYEEYLPPLPDGF